MNLVLRYCRRHWQAILAVAFLAWRTTREDIRRNALLAACVALGTLGLLMNLAVILANGGMPAGVRDEEIPEDARPHYRPIDPSTRLAFLADWIPVGNLLISPGDVLLTVAVAALLARSLLSP